MGQKLCSTSLRQVVVSTILDETADVSEMWNMMTIDILNKTTINCKHVDLKCTKMQYNAKDKHQERKLNSNSGF